MNKEKENFETPHELSANRLQFLLRTIEEQHKIIDRNLTRPAKWRGLTRIEFEGREALDVRERVGVSYNSLIKKAHEEASLNLELLLSVHKDLLDGGGHFRSKGVRVGKKDPVRRPHSSELPSIVEKALERASDGVEPPPLAAARLHLELLIIHPFSDSNGRVARLMASYILMRAGYYSTLLSAVEQHFQVHPRAYARSFRILRSGKERDHAPWLITALEAMLYNSIKATWFRIRKDNIFEALEKADLPQENWIQAAIDYDLSKKTQDTETLSKAINGSTSPIIDIAKDMEQDELNALLTQVERLYREELDETHEIDEYTRNILDVLKKLQQDQTE
jgi:Fic family protein